MVNDDDDDYPVETRGLGAHPSKTYTDYLDAFDVCLNFVYVRGCFCAPVSIKKTATASGLVTYGICRERTCMH